MCIECGCSNEGKNVVVDRSFSEANDALAENNRQYLTGKKIFCTNIVGSPGSGKTTLIEELAKHMGSKYVSVIQGDLESDIDKRRLEAAGIDACQINTHSGCHLNAQMVNRALMDLDLGGRKYLYIENVGNLVCPAGVRLGQHINVVVSSAAEGHDKPFKYPPIFMDASLVVLSKMDLADAAEFDKNQFLKGVSRVAPKTQVYEVSKRQKESFRKVAEFLEHRREHEYGLTHSH